MQPISNSWIPSPFSFWNRVSTLCERATSSLQKAKTSVVSFFPKTEPSLRNAERERRFELLRQHPSLAKKGDHTQGEIELVLDPQKAAKVEQAVKERFMKNGVAQADLEKRIRTGALTEDQFFTLIKDPVIFPNGSEGLYTRLIHTSMLQGTIGAVALPITPDGKIVLNLNFRHATREWEFELPRGFARAGEQPLQTVARELKEETGLSSEPPILLGTVAPDTGILASVPHVYLCRTNFQGTPERGNEAIKKCVTFTPQELANGLVQGYLEHEGQKVFLRDGFLAYALLQAHLQGIVKLTPTAKRV